MFDRYTDKARKVIFFARYETSLSGYPAIDSEHILLGLIREDPFLINNGSIHVEEVRKLIAEKKPVRESLNSHVDVPLSMAVQRVLAYATDEAEKMQDNQINTEHLLLGLLREESTLAGEILNSYGLTYNSVSKKIFNRPKEIQAGQPSGELPDEIEQLLKLSQDMRALAHQMLIKCENIDLLCQKLTNSKNREQKNQQDL